MGFGAIARDSTDSAKVTLLRQALQQPEYTINPNQAYDNLDGDLEIADELQPDRASRRDLLEELRTTNPASTDELLNVLQRFCRSHQREGQERPECERLTLGRVWKLEGMVTLLQAGGASRSEAVRDLRNIIENLAVEAQKVELGSKLLSLVPTMWAFHDPSDEANPFADVGKSRGPLVNSLGLGHYNEGSGKTAELICWGHQLPPKTPARTPTAWDAEDSPYWRPGGRTFPLDNDASKGLPEIVHAALTGDALTIKMDYVTT